jgi:hypothetical protein
LSSYTNISEEHAASIFRVEVSGVRMLMDYMGVDGGLASKSYGRDSGDETQFRPIGAGNRKTVLFRAARGESQFKRKCVSWPTFMVTLKTEQLNTP